MGDSTTCEGPVVVEEDENLGRTENVTCCSVGWVFREKGTGNRDRVRDGFEAGVTF